MVFFLVLQPVIQLTDELTRVDEKLKLTESLLESKVLIQNLLIIGTSFFFSKLFYNLQYFSCFTES